MGISTVEKLRGKIGEKLEKPLDIPDGIGYNLFCALSDALLRSQAHILRKTKRKPSVAGFVWRRKNNETKMNNRL